MENYLFFSTPYDIAYLLYRLDIRWKFVFFLSAGCDSVNEDIL